MAMNVELCKMCNRRNAPTGWDRFKEDWLVNGHLTLGRFIFCPCRSCQDVGKRKFVREGSNPPPDCFYLVEQVVGVEI